MQCIDRHFKVIFAQARFKRRGTAVLTWLDCSTAVARLGFRRPIKYSRIKQLFFF